MIYGGGMLELGQTYSLEQQVIDNDIIMMERKFMEGIPVTDETLAVDAIKFIGIGNDFIAHPSTMEQIDLASDPEIFDRTMLGEWRANGKKDAVDRAHEKVVDILANHIVTPVPDDVMAAWEKIVKEADEVFLKNKE
jgi:trimethylamine--corrinoid protein Co-methyltransferase